MKGSTQQALATSLLHLTKADEYAQRGLDDELVLDACALRLIAMLDALSSLPEHTRERLFGDDWILMRGMRNRLVHGYATVDAAIVAVTIRDELPVIRRAIEREQLYEVD